MHHNELKIKILKSILELENFTVSELCMHSDLKRDRVYNELSKLQNNEILTSETFKSSNSEKRAAHRPSKLYRLVDNPEKRRYLVDQILPFSEDLKDKVQYIENASAQKANRELDKISLEIENLDSSANYFSKQAISQTQKKTEELCQRLHSVKDDLELAIYESNVVVDANETPEHPLVINSKRWRQYSEKAKKIQSRTNSIAAKFDAERYFTQIIRQFVEDEKLTSNTAIATLNDEWHKADNVELKRILRTAYSDISMLPVNETHSNVSHSLRKKLIEIAIRQCADPKLILESIQTYADNPKLEEEKWNTINYDLANAHELAGHTTEAFYTWKEWVQCYLLEQKFKFAEFEYPFCNHIDLITTRYDSYNLDRSLNHLEEITDPNVDISAVCLDISSLLELENQVIPPTFFNPSKSHPATVKLGDSLRQYQSDLSVSGSLEQRMEFPGLPLIKIATVLVSMGLDVVKAWEMAQKIKPETTLIIVSSLQRMQKLSEDLLNKVFSDSLIAFDEFETNLKYETADSEVLC